MPPVSERTGCPTPPKRFNRSRNPSDSRPAPNGRHCRGQATRASLLAQCRRCKATGTARITPRGATTYLPIENGRHRGCGGWFRLFKAGSS